MKQYFNYIGMVLFTIFFFAVAAAILDFYQTGTPFKGQQIGDLLWHGFYLILVVIMSREVPAYIWSYAVVALFSAWISQPGQRKKISKLIGR